MTIPSRPAPAPPGARGQNAAAGANASIEQLRRQLEQQQNDSAQKLTIKLPPPPKGPVNGLTNTTNSYHYNNNNNNNSTDTSSITRKFPKARYAPATNWDDSPFDAAAATANGNFKKVPPPRPPPPRVQVNGRKTTAPVPPKSTQSAGLLTNIFHRKKTTATTKAASTAGAANRIYGVSSGTHSSSSSSTTSSATTHISTNSYSSSSWNANWNTNSSHSAATFCALATKNSHSSGTQEAQLISFDSPPSSPTFTQKSNSDCVSVDSFSSDSNFSSPNNGSVSQPESGFEDDFSASRSRPPTTSPLDPWETLDAFSGSDYGTTNYNAQPAIGTAPVRNLSTINTRLLGSNDNPLCNGKSLLPPAPSLAAPTIIKPKISQKPKAPRPPVLAKPYQNYNGGSAESPPSPPMPQCAPPPLPLTSDGNFSLLDVITGKVDAIHLDAGMTGSTPYGVALYDFDGVEEGDLNFRENDKIYILEEISSEWCRGRTRAGCEGIFPTNYIDVKVPLSAASGPTNSALSPSATTPTYQQHAAAFSMGYRPVQIQCLYNFPAEVEGDLALKENDLVTVLYRINEDWLHGEVAGRQGQFPANFLEYVPDNIPLP